MAEDEAGLETHATRRMREALSRSSDARKQAIAALGRIRALLWVVELGLAHGEPSRN